MAILNDTSLAAIVRDEIMNPAGGVEKWLRVTLPYVEEAVVVDTGSLDGTREKLEELKSEFSNLRVYDRHFDGFASSRNYSLQQVKTKWTLVLDADEIISDNNHSIEGGYKILKEFFDNHPAIIYQFDFKFLEPAGKVYGEAHTKRLFLNDSAFYFISPLWEHLESPGHEGLTTSRLVKKHGLDGRCEFEKWVHGADIIHFCPGENGRKNKKALHYSEIFRGVAPSQIPGNEEWKFYNPQRDSYK